jgi:deazaflavin-dependent oxidoreductase (nitroreductase family)
MILFWDTSRPSFGRVLQTKIALPRSRGEVKATPASRTRAPNLRWLKSKPVGALRLAFRLPIYLYRLNLGWLLSHRFLLLIHRGRRSGLRRETVLEVARYNPATEESVVLSAWGEQADWYRNIQVTPALEVQTGGERYVPQQRFLAPEENHAVLADYGRRHPLAFQFFARVFGYPLNGTEAARREFAHSLRLVAFHPRNIGEACVSWEGRGCESSRPFLLSLIHRSP